MLSNPAPLCPRYRKLLASGALISLLVLPVGTALRAEEHGQTKGEAGAAASQKGLHTVYWREGMATVEQRKSTLVKAR